MPKALALEDLGAIHHESRVRRPQLQLGDASFGLYESESERDAIMFGFLAQGLREREPYEAQDLSSINPKA